MPTITSFAPVHPTPQFPAPATRELWISVDGAPVRRVAPQAPTLVGRDVRCTVGVAGPSVSAHHLDVRLTPAGWVISDLGSTHGTWIDGFRIDRPTLVDRPLRVVLGHPGGGFTTLDLHPSPSAALVPTFGPPVGPVAARKGGRVVRGIAMAVAVLVLLAGVGAVVEKVAPPRADASPASANRPTGPTTRVPTPRFGADALPATVPPTAPSSVETLEGLYRGDADGEGMVALLTASLEDVHDYWTRVFEQAQLPLPSVGYQWPAAGQTVRIPCADRHGDPDEPSTDTTAVYCGADDKITIAIPMAVGFWQGRLVANRDDHSRAPTGDLSVAFMVAHEYAHNVQRELKIGWDEDGDPLPSIAKELHADCLAGTWANSAWRSHLISDTDAAEAVGALARSGDYRVSRPGHHGTPAQRVDAFELGYTKGAPAACTPLLDTPAAR